MTLTVHNPGLQIITHVNST